MPGILRSNTRRLSNALALFVMVAGLCFASNSKANPLATTLLQQVLVSGPNQGNPQPQRTPSAPVGTIPANFRVDDRGSAQLSIPIEVPPAARGVQPQLSLEYDSQLGNGPLGVGWRLGGLSAITRCNHNLAEDGEVAAVRMSDQSKAEGGVDQFDDYGNPTVRRLSSDTGPTTLDYHFETAYQNDPTTWLLGLPTNETVYFFQSGVPQRSREATASYDSGTGALQARITEPNDIDLYLHENFSYDDHGNVYSVTAVDADVNVRTTSVAYDTEGVFPITSTNALGQQTTLSWDRGLGVPSQGSDPNNLRTVGDYDGFGRVTGIRYFRGDTPRGDETTITYAALPAAGDDPVLEVIAETDGHGHVATQYDRRGRVVLESELDLDGIERFVATEYDHLDRVYRNSLRTPTGQTPTGWEVFEYDFADRLAVRTLPDGSSPKSSAGGRESRSARVRKIQRAPHRLQTTCGSADDELFE